jgi:hypothetical protein
MISHPGAFKSVTSYLSLSSFYSVTRWVVSTAPGGSLSALAAW